VLQVLLDSEGIDAYDQARRALLSKQQQEAQLLFCHQHSSCLFAAWHQATAAPMFDACGS
jgi:hypothetical protein